MLDLFTNPFTMIMGALLISSPIIIHLINRMRFKRIRWAAMEFLLKSQKRSRRKMIIEQLILLLLRILLVLLAGLLLARFIGCDSVGNDSQNTYHLILIDDTASMADFQRADDGQSKEVFNEAKRLTVERIARSAAQAPNPQFIEVIRLSDLDNPRNFGRLNSIVVEDIRTYLNPIRPTQLHIPLENGLKKAKNLFDNQQRMRHVLHIVSDFRSADWAKSREESLGAMFEEFKRANVETHMLDVASPERTPAQKNPLANDNLSLIDLRPETRIAAKFAPVEFTVDVKNNSNSEKKNVNVRVRVNGEERAEGLVNIPSLPPNSVTSSKFVLQLNRVADDKQPTDEAALERFNFVSAHLDNEPAGLAADNVRYTTVEVRDRVPMLIIDSNPTLRGKKESESFFLYKLFTEPIKGFDVQIRNPSELEQLNLQQYVSIFICDVPKLSPVAVKNLEEYVQGGGGLAFFMGPSIKSPDAQFYNNVLYRNGEGLFPAPIKEKPANEGVTDEERTRLKMERTFSFTKQLLVRREARSHPALERLYKDQRGQNVSEEEYEKFFLFVIIDRYFVVDDLAWKAKRTTADTLMYLPNLKPMSDYQDETRKLTDRLPIDEGKFEAYKESLQKYRDDIRRVAGSTQKLHVLASALTGLLEDAGDKATQRPSMKEFWQMPENMSLAEDLAKLRDLVKYGDPLYVAKNVGKGRVTAFMSSAGASWNDLDSFGRAYYPPLMINLQSYLASSGTDVNLTLGTPFDINVEKTNYDAKIKKWFQSEDERSGKAGALIPKGEQVLATAGEMYRLPFDEGKEPGVYLFKFSEKRPDPNKSGEFLVRSDFRALSYNLDAVAEGDLSRANSDDVVRIAKGAPLHTVSDDSYSDALMRKRRDLSESPWLYLIIMLVLIAEQAMAVRLSYNSRPASAPV